MTLKAADATVNPVMQVHSASESQPSLTEKPKWPNPLAPPFRLVSPIVPTIPFNIDSNWFDRRAGCPGVPSGLPVPVMQVGMSGSSPDTSTGGRSPVPLAPAVSLADDPLAAGLTADRPGPLSRFLPRRPVAPRLPLCPDPAILSRVQGEGGGFGARVGRAMTPEQFLIRHARPTHTPACALTGPRHFGRIPQGIGQSSQDSLLRFFCPDLLRFEELQLGKPLPPIGQPASPMVSHAPTNRRARGSRLQRTANSSPSASMSAGVLPLDAEGMCAARAVTPTRAEPGQGGVSQSFNSAPPRTGAPRAFSFPLPPPGLSLIHL